ncbi:hypothetical protein EXIGLDRAFT_719201 [Exidia glandulosa HHB12029]|uniref:DUF1690-domain-containing protein n=1 Tax=Exidia glandulosa HHB12029 TaxID=1314781 RepID=A0A165H8J2_EXIGL|nr:hypothetical protein EXIGLDRAFT_719201 [Exidia glandulosa HHB12029]
MGASSSKPAETVVHNEAAIHFSQDLVNQLSDQITSPNVTPERQATLDAHVRSRIQAEMAKLRQEEQEVMRQITTALEKENIDREKALDGADSASLKHDLEQMQARIKAFEGRKRLATEFPQVQHARDALVACYKNNLTTSLNCYQEVAEFKDAVAKVERKFVESLKTT